MQVVCTCNMGLCVCSLSAAYLWASHSKCVRIKLDTPIWRPVVAVDRILHSQILVSYTSRELLGHYFAFYVSWLSSQVAIGQHEACVPTSSCCSNHPWSVHSHAQTVAKGESVVHLSRAAFTLSDLLAQVPSVCSKPASKVMPCLLHNDLLARKSNVLSHVGHSASMCAFHWDYDSFARSRHDKPLVIAGDCHVIEHRHAAGLHSI